MKRVLKVFVAILMIFTVLVTQQKKTYARTFYRDVAFVRIKGNRLYYRKLAECVLDGYDDADRVGIGKTYSYKINKKTKYYMKCFYKGKFIERISKKKFLKKVSLYFKHKKKIGYVYWLDGHELKKQLKRTVYMDEKISVYVKNKTITKIGILQAD